MAYRRDTLRPLEESPRWPCTTRSTGQRDRIRRALLGTAQRVLGHRSPGPLRRTTRDRGRQRRPRPPLYERKRENEKQRSPPTGGGTISDETTEKDVRKHHKKGRGGNVTGWYPWVITRETLALQPYERSTPTRRMRRQNGFAGSHGHYCSVLKGHLSAPVRELPPSSFSFLINCIGPAPLDQARSAPVTASMIRDPANLRCRCYQLRRRRHQTQRRSRPRRRTPQPPTAIT